MDALTQRVCTASGDSWQAQGRLRTAAGGGATELPGIRLMASGLSLPQWNNGDVTDPELVDLEAVRAWYAARAGGRGVPWGVRVPVVMTWRHGRFALRQRCMGLVPNAFRTVPQPSGVTIRVATADDLEAVTFVDSRAFGEPIDQNRPWVAPQLGAPGFLTAIAVSGAEPVGVATAIHTTDRAGECVGIFGVGVLDHARRRGIGSALTAWLITRALTAGATLVHLNPTGDDQARLYARLGFVETSGFDIYVVL